MSVAVEVVGEKCPRSLVDHCWVRALLALCRRMMVLRLCMGVKLYLRHVVSHMNYADGPSRGFPVGAAPETKKKGEQKVAVRRGQG